MPRLGEYRQTSFEGMDDETHLKNTDHPDKVKVPDIPKKSKLDIINEELSDNVRKLYDFLDMKIYEESKKRSEEKSVILREANIQLEKIISTPEVAQEIEKMTEKLKEIDQKLDELYDIVQDNYHREGELLKYEKDKEKLKKYLEAIKSIEDNITLQMNTSIE